MLANFKLNSFSVEDNIETTKFPAEFLNKVHEEVNRVDTSSEFSSFAQSFLCPTEVSKIGLSEIDKGKETDPLLLKPTPGPDPSSVLSF